MCKMFAVSWNEKKNLTSIVRTLLSYYSNGNTNGWGVASVGEEKIEVMKSEVSAFHYFLAHPHKLKLNNTSSVIGHLRLATSEVCYENTHPFLSEDGSMALSHNGVILEFEKVKKEQMEKGHIFSSKSVDSEILLHGYEDYGRKFIEKLEVEGWKNVLILKKDETIIGVSDGDLYKTKMNGGIILSSTKLYLSSREIKKGYMVVVRRGKVLYRKKIFATEGRKFSGWGTSLSEIYDSEENEENYGEVVRNLEEREKILTW